MARLTEDEFHEALHDELGKPYRPTGKRKHNYPRGHPARRADTRQPDRSHSLRWATAKVNPRTSSIDVQLRINYKTDTLSPDEKQRLKALAKDGITRFWSRTINIGKWQFKVKVTAQHRQGPNALPLQLEINPDPSEYKRSYNPSLPIIDATIVYNEQSSAVSGSAEKDFQLTAAHELGHSVLTHAAGHYHSWTHKGTTHLWQQVKTSRRGYPKNGRIDLMEYYNSEKNALTIRQKHRRTKASDKDIKRLIWGAKFEWIT